MRVLTIPTLQGVAYWTQRTKLDDLEYLLRFAWNQREARWYLDILTEDEQPIALGIKLITNWPLIRFYQWDRRMPRGDLQVVTLSQDQSPPGFWDLGVGLRCELTYFSPE
jgi:hypothetical protein